MCLIQLENAILQLHPPKDAIAGNYSSTLRLNLDTRSNLTFLEILYLQLEVNDRLFLSLIDESPPIPTAQKRFTIQIANPGNMERPLKVILQDGTKLFCYLYKVARLSGGSEEVDLPLLDQRSFNRRSRDCDKVQLSLAPQEEIRLYFTPKLTLKPWRRFWLGRDRQIPFNVELQNVHLDSSEALFLPEPQTGTLLWKPYPRWLIWLLILIPVLILLKVLFSLGYWGLWELAVKPSLMPKVAEFSTVEKIYQEQTNTPAQLNWKIHNLGLLIDVNGQA